ncbi:lipopolysaccharide biosynthesis protein [Pedobacter duraquae]|uniref:O-antigen/teichoic acid export membrane protein n=1 Tax=Pedobacter duraquae TaxID=425511 RepID=A0A4V3C3G6_9SPHI|nr:hypothetical protein [Pedobacter duraquae]TDO21968.1 hypothetical protein CLV32_3077 [Pedobacter duraquae]
MITSIRKFSNKIGIDQAIAYTVFSKILQVFGGVTTLFFVAQFLTKSEQGYYYTFGSILAIQIFFELGLCNIIIQFVAHEAVNLKWVDGVNFTGSLESISRLSSLLRFTLKWFGVIASLFVIGLLITGYCFFNKFGKNDDFVNWQAPWVVLSVVTAISLMAAPLMAFLEGLGWMKEVAKVRFVQQIFQLSFTLIFFASGFKLYAAPVATGIGFMVIPIWIFTGNVKKILVSIWHKIDIYKVNYRNEIFPFQWKIALSWISGYFIFQLFNPVLFATEGPIVAGQMGMTITVLNAILMLTLSWVSTKVPVFSGLIAKKDYKQLDNLFNSTLVQSTGLNVFALIVFFIMIFVLRHYHMVIGGKYFGDRFLAYLPMLFMAIPILLNHILAAWATYLRCHKKEPMLIMSIVIAILSSLSTFFLGHAFGVIGITAGYLLVTVISFVWTYFTFKISKRDWHGA